MRTPSLLGTTLALLIAAPGLALAQANGGNYGNYGNSTGANNFVGQHNGSYYRNGNSYGENGGGMAYANVGSGGYTGMGMPVRNNNGNYGNNNGNYSNNGNNAQNMRPSQRNPLLADNGDVRASKMIGTTVHNANDRSVGSVDDVLIGRNGAWAVVSTNNRKVAVPLRDFEFGNADRNGDDKLVLPNMSQARLNQQPVFHYNANNYGNNNGGGWFSHNGNNGNYNNGRYNNAGNNGGGWFGNNGGGNGNNRG